MKKSVFEIFQKNAQKFYNLTQKEKFHYSHLLYLEIKKILTNITYQSIGFILPSNEHFYIFATIDELISANKEVFIYEQNSNNYLFNKVDSVFQESDLINGFREFKTKKYAHKIPEVIIAPIHIWQNSKGANFDKKINLFLNNIEAKKIAYCLSECETNFDKINELKLVNFDWLILI